MPRRNRLPKVLDKREFLRLLTQLGGQPEPGGTHQQKWRFPTRNGTRTIPISLYDEYPIAYYWMVLSGSLGGPKNRFSRH